MKYKRTPVSTYNTFMKIRLDTGNRTSLSLKLILGIYLTREQTAVQHFSK